MTQQEQIYWQGFMDKCAEFGVNPEELLKLAGNSIPEPEMDLSGMGAKPKTKPTIPEPEMDLSGMKPKQPVKPAPKNPPVKEYPDADTANDWNDVFKGTGIKPGPHGYVDATSGK